MGWSSNCKNVGFMEGNTEAGSDESCLVAMVSLMSNVSLQCLVSHICDTGDTVKNLLVTGTDLY